MKNKTLHLLVACFLMTLFSGCYYITGVPANSTNMDDQWAEICQNEIVSNVSINYLDSDSSKGETRRVCNNNVAYRVTPKEEQENREEVFKLFTKVCKSDILINAKVSTKGRNLGNATRNCTR